jgi:acetyl esterase
MPLDPVIQSLFEEFPQLAIRPVWEKTPAEARALYKQFCQFADPNIVAIGKSEDIKMPGPAAPLGLRVYTPVAAGGAALPAILYLHGGGFVVGDLDCYDGLCRTLANESGCRVISVDYRLAPEHPFPAAVDDAVAGYRALVEERKIAPGSIAIAGDSAGGGLTVATLVAIRQAGLPMPGAAVCISP